MCQTSNSNYYEVRSCLNNVVYTTMRVETVASPVTALQIQIVRINMAIPRTIMIRGISVKSMRHFSFVLLISVSRVADSICEEDDANDRMFLLSIFDPQFRRVRTGRTAGVARSIGLYSCSSFIGFFVVSNSADKVVTSYNCLWSTVLLINHLYFHIDGKRNGLRQRSFASDLIWDQITV